MSTCQTVTNKRTLVLVLLSWINYLACSLICITWWWGDIGAGSQKSCWSTTKPFHYDQDVDFGSSYFLTLLI